MSGSRSAAAPRRGDHQRVVAGEAATWAPPFRWPAVRIALYAAAVTLFVFASISPAMRASDGALGREFALFFSLAAALAIVASALGTRWLRAALWGSVLLAGQASTLQFLDAGRLIHFQHYRVPARWLAEVHPVALGVAALECVLVAFALRKRAGGWILRLVGNLRPWRVLLLVLFCAATSAALSREPAFYLFDVAFAVFVQLLHLGALALAVDALPRDAAAGMLKRFSAVPARRIVITCALGVTAACSVLTCFVYQRHPHVADEVVYLYHARYFAAGRLTLELPPVPAAFDVDLMNYEKDRWFCPVPPGWPAMLAVERFRAPWLIDPLLAGICIFLAYALLRRLYNQRTAMWSVLLLSISPWYLFMGMNYMTHTFSLLCMLAALLLVDLSRSRPGILYPLAAGLFAGLGTLIRPLDGAVAGVVAGAWVIGIGGRRLQWKGIIAFALMAAAIAALWRFPITRHSRETRSNRPSWRTRISIMALIRTRLVLGRTAALDGPSTPGPDTASPNRSSTTT